MTARNAGGEPAHAAAPAPAAAPCAEAAIPPLGAVDRGRRTLVRAATLAPGAALVPGAAWAGKYGRQSTFAQPTESSAELAQAPAQGGPAPAPMPAAPAGGAARPAAASGAPRIVDRFEVGPDVYVRALTVERESNTLWIGTSAGVNEVDLKSGARRNTFTRQHGLANEYVFAVGIDTQGYKWFGTNSGGASRYKDGKWKTYFPMHGLADYWIYAFQNDRDGNLWIGTWAGASHYNVKTGAFKTYRKELINEWVYGLAMDAKGRIWFGTEGGVSMFDGRAWKSWSHKDGIGGENVDALPPSANTGLGTRSRHDLSTATQGAPTYNPNYVFSTHVAPDQTVWVGTWGGGVSRYDGKAWKNYTSRDGLSGNIVYSIAQDAQGVFWFGTSNGLTRWDGKTWTRYTTAEGMLDAHVYAIAVAPNGDVWAGTRRGVVRIARQ